ncbi:hypothetical protein SSP35_05_00470 [Streptomyces sp. NBRC 110611]|uniref:hypothetical protein n=1 Tax=Streptomyces sp. NBRC 110611 TaxID=1621259 RepID=UPI00082B05E5|nr:hypothetical protein [Streptomyces sp. NBRC 110611]GAU67480.1 hypothetical protein SSP35_05_00470 [Streptomyces sp. NBRC 110611]
MNADNKAPATGDRDVLLPMDNHQPISGAGVATQVKEAVERDILPMDNHQPIIGAAATAKAKKKAGERDDTLRPMDNHQPITTPMVEDDHQSAPGKGVSQKD